MAEKVRSEQLTRKQETFLAAMLTLPTIEAAAAAAGVTSKTARQWMKKPHVQEAYTAARRQAFDAALDTLQDVVTESIRTLRIIHLDKETPQGVRVRAAQILLESAINVHKLSEMESEIAELKCMLREHDRQKT